MRKRRMAEVACVGVLMILLVGACAPRFDAKEYTQAVLDVTYKNQADNYSTVTGSSQEEAEEIFQKNLDATMDAFQNVALSEELEERYRSLFQEIVQQVNYTVEESVETKEDEYEVHVTVKPLSLFDDTYDEFQQKSEAYAKKITEQVLQSGEMPEDEEVQNQVYEIYYENLRQQLEESVHYKEAESVVLHIHKLEDDTYEISAEDLKMLNQTLISREKLQN